MAILDLSRLTFHPDLLDLAERFLGSDDLRLYEAELWAKYAGAVDYDQSHHRDFGNHSLVVPKRSDPPTQMQSLILLSDVTELDGPTKVVPLSLGKSVPFWPSSLVEGGTDLAKTYLPAGTFAEERFRLRGRRTLFCYRPDVLHRGSRMIGERSARFTLSAHYNMWGHAGPDEYAWPANALGPNWCELIERASPRERSVLGFPGPGDPYWDEQNLADTPVALPPVRFNALLLRAADQDRSGIRAGALSRFAQQLHSGSGWSVPVRR